jgi:hypothetical protein
VWTLPALLRALAHQTHHHYSREATLDQRDPASQPRHNEILATRSHERSVLKRTEPPQRQGPESIAEMIKKWVAKLSPAEQKQWREHGTFVGWTPPRG